MKVGERWEARTNVTSEKCVSFVVNKVLPLKYYKQIENENENENLPNAPPTTTNISASGLVSGCQGAEVGITGYTNFDCVQL